MTPEAEAALRAVASQFAATRTDLERIATTLQDSPVPLVGDFVGEVRSLLRGRTFDTYRHHLDRLARDFGNRRLDELSILDLERAAIAVREDALQRSSATHGYGAQESFVNATRFVFVCAIKAGHLRANPAAGLSRPRRRRSRRRALSADELDAVFSTVIATSRDPELDLLILAFARETACRREGILNARLSDLHPAPSIVLYEKFEEQREIPLSPQLAESLTAHAHFRAPGDPIIFHYRDGSRLTERRFDTIFQRLGQHLPWARALGISLHWIRYTTLTDIRLVAGERVAAAYAGHNDDAGGVTAIYTRATFDELQAAHRRLFHG